MQAHKEINPTHPCRWTNFQLVHTILRAVLNAQLNSALAAQERSGILEQVETAATLHLDAEKEADKAIAQLEDFITEQEELVSCPAQLLCSFLMSF